ncbi:MAG: hypothetical protein H6597_06440 [Flavobacteriales bacterium]|nr:hypothetical protein [Flavobacteriales bacterium]
MMIRVLLDELGIHLPLGQEAKIKERQPKSWYLSKTSKPGLTIKDIEADSAGSFLHEALRFGNRAIAHVEDNDMDHNFRTAQDDPRLVQAIDYVEDKVVHHIYSTRAEYDRVMMLCNNHMHRERVDLARM